MIGYSEISYEGIGYSEIGYSEIGYSVVGYRVVGSPVPGYSASRYTADVPHWSWGTSPITDHRSPITIETIRVIVLDNLPRPLGLLCGHQDLHFSHRA